LNTPTNNIQVSNERARDIVFMALDNIAKDLVADQDSHDITFHEIEKTRVFLEGTYLLEREVA
tara:strand:+ start:1707 stop:1895 length:189 start_codon:yes stop_codon:yes gene_type:complete